jgi:hypothetical protein
MAKKSKPISGLRVNGRPVYAEAGVRKVCGALQYVATRGNGAGVEPAPRQLLEAIGDGRVGVFNIHDDSALELAPRLREMAEQANAEDDFDLASVLAGVASALEMAKEFADNK